MCHWKAVSTRLKTARLARTSLTEYEVVLTDRCRVWTGHPKSLSKFSPSRPSFVYEGWTVDRHFGNSLHKVPELVKRLVFKSVSAAPYPRGPEYG